MCMSFITEILIGISGQELASAGKQWVSTTIGVVFKNIMRRIVSCAHHKKFQGGLAGSDTREFRLWLQRKKLEPASE